MPFDLIDSDVAESVVYDTQLIPRRSGLRIKVGTADSGAAPPMQVRFKSRR